MSTSTNFGPPSNVFSGYLQLRTFLQAVLAERGITDLETAHTDAELVSMAKEYLTAAGPGTSALPTGPFFPSDWLISGS